MKKIKLHISSKIKYTTLLFILILFFSNCRKDNYENEIIPFDKTSILTDFFKILPNEDQEIKSLAENLKKKIHYLIFYQISLQKMASLFGIKYYITLKQ